MQEFLNTSRLFSMTPWKQGNVNVYLLLDCADRKETVIKTLKKLSSHEMLPLYLGTKDEKDADIGPHLVRVSRDSDLLQWFLQEGAEFGIILFSEGSLELLGHHLQPYLECLWPDDQWKMFRFYDPMTFYYFIPNLTPEELRLFMGPVCGAACTRPVCAEEGDSLFLEQPIALELYVPPKRRMPWFISENSFENFGIPAGYSLALTLAEYFHSRHRRFFKRLDKASVLNFTKTIADHNHSIGFTRQSNVKKYMDQVVDIGINYKDDPQFLRIAQAINTNDTEDEISRSLLNEMVIFYTDVLGENGEKYYQALQNVMRTSYERWHHPNTATERLFAV